MACLHAACALQYRSQPLSVCPLHFIKTHILHPFLLPPSSCTLGLALTVIACLTFAAKLLDLNVVGAINQVRKGGGEGGREG